MTSTWGMYRKQMENMLQGNQLEDIGVGCGSALDRLNLEFKEAKVRKEFGYMGFFTGVVRDVWEYHELGILVS